MSNITNIAEVERLGDEIAVLAGLKPETIAWTVLYSKELFGHHFNLKHVADLKRIKFLTKCNISELPDVVEDVIAIRLTDPRSELARHIIHEVTHILKPPYLLPTGSWSDIHHAAFKATFWRLLIKYRLNWFSRKICRIIRIMRGIWRVKQKKT